ncbi:MAG: hypothetical protein ACRDMV_01300 [Streptosporangiales bacterium]
MDSRSPRKKTEPETRQAPAAKPEAKTPKAKTPKVCRVPECDRAPLARGLCGAHWASRRGE